MKKIIYSLLITCSFVSLGFSQSALITPNSSNVKLKNDATITSDFLANSIGTFLQNDGNLKMGFLTNGRFKVAITSNPSDANQGDLAIGRPIIIGGTNADILSRTHSYGVGENAVTYGGYYPFKSSVLGQAYGNVTTGTNRVGVLGMTDGQATSGSYNIGVAGIGSNTTAVTAGSSVYALFGYTDVNSSSDAYGGYNYSNNAGNGTTYGGFNHSRSAGTGIVYGNYNYAYKPSSSGTTYGSYNNSSNYGSSPAYGSYNYGYAQNNDSYGSYNSASTYSTVNGNYAYGSYNYAFTNAESEAYGMYGKAENSTQASGFTWGDTYGGYGEGINNASSYSSYGLYGKAGGTSTGSKIGVYGNAFSNTGTKYGIYGFASGTGTNYAGYFSGNVTVSGSLSKGSGTFKIDHPLDPENKYLYHSFVESPDMMNIYNGNITTDANGDAKVTLPAYFDALNKDFRYQLTTIGKKADAWIAEELVGNTFKISTDQPNTKVSWQVTGVRQDAFANANRVIPEMEKKGEEKGKYLHPEAFGKAASMGIDFANQKAPSPSKATKEQQTQPEIPKPQLSTSWPTQIPKPAKEGTTTDSAEPKKE